MPPRRLVAAVSRSNGAFQFRPSRKPNQQHNTRMKHIARLARKFALPVTAFAALAFTASAQAVAEVPAEITDMTTNASTVWTTVKALIVGVVAFGILIAIVKRVTRK